MLALGVLGLTGCRRNFMKSQHDRAWKEAKRRQCRISVTCAEVVQKDDDALHQEPGNNVQLGFAMELLNGPVEQVSNIINSELLRLTWANRAALKGRIVALNVDSQYLDSLVKRAAGEEVGGFALCSKDDQPLQTDQVEAIMKRIQDVFQGLSLESMPPVWLIFGTNVSSLMAADGPRIVRVNGVRDFISIKEEVFLLPGSEFGHYEDSWVPDIVTHSLSKNDTMSTLNSLEGLWSWLSAEINIHEYESKQDLAARMRNLELYNETRLLC